MQSLETAATNGTERHCDSNCIQSLLRIGELSVGSFQYNYCSAGRSVQSGPNPSGAEAAETYSRVKEKRRRWSSENLPSFEKKTAFVFRHKHRTTYSISSRFGESCRVNVEGKVS
jgi:hypothetical protein